MLRFIILFSFVIVSRPVFPQFTKTYTAKMNHSWFNCDSHKNLYVISDNKFQKFPPPYETGFNFDLPNNESPSYIDTNNPNQIVLFFRNSQKVILLDSLLNQKMRPFFLDEIGLFEISIVFPAHDGGLWFYNYLKNSLTRLNKEFLPEIRGLSLNPYFQLPNYPNYVVSFNNRFYLNIPSTGILVLGKNGEYQTAVQLTGLFDFQIDNNAIYYYSDHIIYCYNYRNLKTKKIYIPEEPDILNAWFFENEILILTKDTIAVYQHNINPTDDQAINYH